MSKATFYKKRKGSMICGVVAGLSDKYGWELPLARILAALFMYIFYIKRQNYLLNSSY